SSTLMEVIIPQPFPSLSVLLSTDGGTTWNSASNELGRSSPTRVVFDPFDNNTAYLASSPVTASPFVAELDSVGGSLVYSTYLNGVADWRQFSENTGAGIAAFQGDVFVTGTGSPYFPGTTILQNYGYVASSFVARISAAVTPCTYTVSPVTQVITL